MFFELSTGTIININAIAKLPKVDPDEVNGTREVHMTNGKCEYIHIGDIREIRALVISHTDHLIRSRT
jgi:hypothetical protein